MYSSTLRELLSQIAAAVGISVVLGLFSAGPLCAWEGETHSLITRLALQNDPALRKQVPAETLEDFLAATEYKTVPAFVQALHLNPSTAFPFKVPKKSPDDSKQQPDDPAQRPEYEKPGDLVAILDVLSTYVNEPDWGMDRDICRFYPGFCNKDYKFMGAFQSGLASQAFRHMYWTGYLKLLSKFLPLPQHKHAPLGEAPERSQLFFDLSVQAARTGHPYWAARFLAWSMHYTQDVAQPFHASQLPSPKLERKKNLIPDIKMTARQIAYYHLAFEGYISFLLTSGAYLGDMGKEIQQFLQQSISQTGGLLSKSALETTKAAAEYSVTFAAQAAYAAIKFFPLLPHNTKDLEKYLKSIEFKQEVLRRSQPGPTLDKFVAIAQYCLAEAGTASRTLLALFYRQTLPKPLGPPISSKELQKQLDTLNFSF